MDFDDPIDRRGTDCAKWDKMEKIYGVSPDDGLAMWVADSDFRAPPVVRDALQKVLDHGVFGYVNFEASYKEAIRWWMSERHGWTIEDDASIFTTTGLVNAVGLCLDTYTQPGDEIVLFTPVYHAFARVIGAAGRKVAERQMVLENDRYVPDFDAWDAMMTGAEKMAILCSPHNPGGRVWTREELEGIAAFCKRHDLYLVSDEIHQDLVFPGHTHIPMANIDGVAERLIMLNAPSKTFNIAGLHTGNVIIPDPALRAPFARRMSGLNLAGNSLGQYALQAAYSPEGAAWTDAQVAYLDENRKLFDKAVNAIPGLRSMPLESTYLAWVDFSGTGMERAEFTRRVEEGAKIAANHGPTFGAGGQSFLRFNLATQHARVEEATRRLQEAFADLQ